jgi:hypothetical protein
MEVVFCCDLGQRIADGFDKFLGGSSLRAAHQTDEEILSALSTALSRVTALDACGWFNACGYKNLLFAASSQDIFRRRLCFK